MLSIKEPYQGIYEISESVNGQPSWEKGAEVIWYSPNNNWVMGPTEYVGTTWSSLYATPNSGGLTDDTNEWKYYDSPEWKTSPPGDIDVKCMKY